MFDTGAKRSISVTARSFSVIDSVVVTGAGHLERTVDIVLSVVHTLFYII